METKQLCGTIQTYFLGSLFLLTAILFPPNVHAEDYTQLRLPAGAKTRIGKGTINDIKFSPDGNLVAVAGSIGVWLYNAQTGAEVALLTGHTQPVWSVAFSPDSKNLTSGSGDTTIRLWDVETGQHKVSLTQHTYGIWAVTFSPDGKTLASSSYGSVRLWDIETGRHKAVLDAQTGRARALAFSPDGSILANGGHALPLTSNNYMRVVHKSFLLKNSFDMCDIPSGKFPAEIHQHCEL